MRRLREVLLWAGAALGILAMAAGLAVTFFGFSFLIFRSGSMEPEISTGAVALSRTVEAEDIRVGDVVSVIAGNGDRITHRVVSTTLRGDEATLVLQGDANATEDSELYVVASADRVVASVPWGGYVLAHALTPPGLVALACLSLMLLVSGFSRVEDDEDDIDDAGDIASTPRTPGGKHRGPRRFAAAALVTATVVGGSSGTLAAFTDVNSAQTGSFGAGAIATPVVSSVSQAPDGSISINWTATAVGTRGIAATNYDTLRYAVASGGSAVIVCSATAALSCVDTSPPIGTVYYSVRARFGAQWVKEGARRSFVVADVIAPQVSIQSPINGCAAVACGTATDTGGGVVSVVEYTLARKRVGKITGVALYSCWTGTGWTIESLSATTCSYASASGTATWTVPGSNGTAYQNNGLYSETYTLSVRATDSYNNVGTPVTSGFSRS